MDLGNWSSLVSGVESRTSGPLFDGFFLGGFECACQRLIDGKRLDLTASTRHDDVVRDDYARLRELGMTACRDGISWVHSEPSPGRYDFTRAAPLIAAARASSLDVFWDLMHFGWPDGVDVFAPSFPTRFARYARAFARWYRDETDRRLLVTPINEISFISWAGGDVRCLNPFESARGVELKVALVRATIAAIDEIRAVVPNARFLQPEPVINIVPNVDQPKTWRRVESDNLLQYQACDMLCGRSWPQLGGSDRYLDIVGVNFYPDNQFMLDGTTVWRGDKRYRPFARMLEAVWHRYRRPMIVSETGAEGDHRAEWLSYVAAQCAEAIEEGVELHGVTVYPVLDYKGWVDGRDCQTGVWGHADARGRRAAHQPSVDALLRHAPTLREARNALLKQRG